MVQEIVDNLLIAVVERKLLAKCAELRLCLHIGVYVLLVLAHSGGGGFDGLAEEQLQADNWVSEVLKVHEVRVPQLRQLIEIRVAFFFAILSPGKSFLFGFLDSHFLFQRKDAALPLCCGLPTRLAFLFLS